MASATKTRGVLSALASYPFLLSLFPEAEALLAHRAVEEDQEGKDRGPLVERRTAAAPPTTFDADTWRDAKTALLARTAVKTGIVAVGI